MTETKGLLGTGRANDVIYKPCPAGHLNPQVHKQGNAEVVMCRDPNCGWAAPSYTWNNRAPPKLIGVKP